MDTTQMVKAANKAVVNAPTKEDQRKRVLRAPSLVVGDLVKKYEVQIREALGRAMDPERFTRLLITVIAQNPNLLRAVNEAPQTLIGAILSCAQLGLEPNTPLGHCYLIPYFEKDKVASADAGHEVFKMKVNLQLGYQGTLVLSYRSGDIAEVDTQTVYEKDFFKYQLGTNRFIQHVPFDGEDPGEAVKYYAVIKLKSGGVLFKVWSKSQVMSHAKKFAKSWNNKYQKFFGPWADNFDAMAKKTVLLDCLKLAPKSSSLAQQLAADNTTKSVSLDQGDFNVLAQRNEDFALNGDRKESKAIAYVGDDDPAVASVETPSEKPVDAVPAAKPSGSSGVMTQEPLF